MTNPTTSRLDDKGREQIQESCQVTFDISSGQLLKSDVGLDADESPYDIALGGLITLRLIGTNGALEAHTDRIRFFTTSRKPDLSVITYFLTADTPEEFFMIIREGADAYGFDQESVEREIEDMTNYPHEEAKVALQPGYKLGFQVVYDLRYRGPGHVNTIIVSVNPGESEPH